MMLLQTLVGEWEGRQGGGHVEMSGELWGRLPDELLEDILLLTPPASRCRFRAVCRSWRALLLSPDMICYRIHVPPSVPHVCRFILGRKEELGGRSSEVDLSFLPPMYFRAGSPYIIWEKGLICAATGHPFWEFIDELAICVFNPFTRAFLELPRISLPPHIPRHRHWKLHLVVPTGAGFKVMFLLQRQNNTCAVGLYASSTNTWTFNILGRAGLLSSYSFSNDFIYTGDESHLCISTPISGGNGAPSWDRVPAPRFIMDRDVRVTFLVQHCSNLYAVQLSKPMPSNLVGCGFWKKQGNKWQNMSIWHMQTGFEVDRITLDVGNQEEVFLGEAQHAIVLDDFIFVTLASSQDNFRHLLPRLLGFRISPNAKQLLLEVDLLISIPVFQSSVQLFHPTFYPLL